MQFGCLKSEKWLCYLELECLISMSFLFFGRVGRGVGGLPLIWKDALAKTKKGGSQTVEEAELAVEYPNTELCYGHPSLFPRIQIFCKSSELAESRNNKELQHSAVTSVKGAVNFAIQFDFLCPQPAVASHVFICRCIK